VATLSAEAGNLINWPVAGFENSARLAAYRVEMVYQKITIGKQRAV
jgi:hypothetical protein